MPICIASAGRNIVRNEKYLKFLHSIDNQNYSNYKLVITDDASPDKSYKVLRRKIQEFPRLRARTTLIKN